ncbi:hypothetical protein C922_05358 [Plasmodium inui San Antonio 1]|uniref:Uncharacterized protein n=1 Tax=Plasmodium inui San Antonio 1 TaxID=1237626 RepID=W7AG30_9APIC|nr:hypothetical protein C922_05358 [Plasmodium inui San Antonio 1]EUD64256.1 hypothetical protein C922_05358 [Plasmodium inui San Antonio 1]
MTNARSLKTGIPSILRRSYGQNQVQILQTNKEYNMRNRWRSHSRTPNNPRNSYDATPEDQPQQ